MGTLDKDDFNFCYRAAIICYGATGSIQVPREMRLKAVLSDYHGKDTLVSAGSTGSGKTLQKKKKKKGEVKHVKEYYCTSARQLSAEWR